MGVDITLRVIRNDKIILDDMFEGRDCEWFDNISEQGYDVEYDHLITFRGIPDIVPEVIKDDYESESGYYDFRYITIRDFLDFCNDYEPWLHAGWGTTYSKWLYEKKGIVPTDMSIYHESGEVDAVFFEYTNKHDSSLWLYNLLYEKIAEGIVEKDDLIIYYFDR